MRMRKKTYPSDVSREQFGQILPILEQARKRTKLRTVDLYEVWCAVLYLLRTGCAPCPAIFPSGERCTHTFPSGANWTMRE